MSYCLSDVIFRGTMNGTPILPFQVPGCELASEALDFLFQGLDLPVGSLVVLHQIHDLRRIEGHQVNPAQTHEELRPLFLREGPGKVLLQFPRDPPRSPDARHRFRTKPGQRCTTKGIPVGLIFS